MRDKYTENETILTARIVAEKNRAFNSLRIKNRIAFFISRTILSGNGPRALKEAEWIIDTASQIQE